MRDGVPVRIHRPPMSDSIERQVNRKRAHFAQQVLLIEELKRIKRRPLKHDPFAAPGIPQHTMDQINMHRIKLDRSDDPALSVKEHADFLRALKLFSVDGFISLAGFEKIGQMLGRPASLMRAHLTATQSVVVEDWPREHVEELRQWRMTLPQTPTLADVLGLKQLRCGKGRTVEEITHQLRVMGGQRNMVVPPAPGSAPPKTRGLLDRLMLDNQAIHHEMSQNQEGDPDKQTSYQTYLTQRLGKNLEAIDRLSPFVRSEDLAGLGERLGAKSEQPSKEPANVE
eukprot:TRINITY_DN48981_c0_g1_i2.p1 TRINITY_DN48981_c0_g1~~TRINITY_DN48981_c0_g1_i2.p1  ORF type:complete len:284 (+),score=76.36 TRINITY_DN48981_c0_g1_i2:15-866(+)